MFSFMRATIAIVHLFCKAWSSTGAFYAVSVAFAIASVALLVSCAHLLLSILEELESDDVDLVEAAYLKKTAFLLTIYLIVTAMVSFVHLSYWRRSEADTVAPESTSSSKEPLTLKDVTLKTLLIPVVRDEAKSSVDPDELNVCCVCLCEMLPGETVSELTCHHRYHTSCLEGWEVSQREKQKPMVCPLRCDMRSAGKVDDDDQNVVIGALP
eukprot:TRINITY_DN25900_c0_g1_i2.p1 TRINITY_DN25900_c0_g1~~TRINITY_DN25900_c0_g1_i2.p1  ORF type:complete len:212 (-),score=23.60 TRINITY_DN25900_c0_g1_i2:573-1208(-)